MMNNPILNQFAPIEISSAPYRVPLDTLYRFPNI